MTPAFMKWFGDSKVVDAKGRPLVVYHGSKSAWIPSFSLEKEGTGVVNTGSRKLGVIWFTSSRDNASFYSDNRPKKMADEADIQVYGDDGRFYYSVNERPDSDDGGDSIFQDGPFEEYTEAEEAGRKEAIRYNKYLRANTFITKSYLRIINPLMLDGVVPRDEEINKARTGGHDGIIAHDVVDGQYHGTVYAVFNPSRIKSANNAGTFDPNQTNIRDSLEEEADRLICRLIE